MYSASYGVFTALAVAGPGKVLEGAGVNGKTSRVHRLTPGEMETLVQIVCDDSGANLARPAFTDAMLQLFEDVAGFETLPVTLRRKYLNLLWLRYQIACGTQKRGIARKLLRIRR
jgi:hypothetical protein